MEYFLENKENDSLNDTITIKETQPSKQGMFLLFIIIPVKTYRGKLL